MIRVGRNIFLRDGWYYFRWKVKGQSRRISLRTKNVNEARARAKEVRTHLAIAAATQRPPETRFRSVAEILEFYSSAKFPRRNGEPRSGTAAKEENRRAEAITRLSGEIDPLELCAADWRQYCRNRLDEFKKGSGERSIDLEWVTLNSAFRYAAQHPRETGIQTGITFPKPERLRRASDVTHCRDFQPANAEELHKLAAHFLLTHKAEVFGWYVLLAAMIGQRLSEMLRLRADASDIDTPGFDDGAHLWLYRSKTHKGTAATVKIGPELRETLSAHRAWLQEKAPASPWFFPSPRNQAKPLKAQSVAHALPKACQTLGIPPRTAHGLRSYFVNVLRSRDIPDAEIALRIGHKSGGRLIVETYGERLPIRLDWLPEQAPAWQRFNPTKPKIVAAQFA